MRRKISRNNFDSANWSFNEATNIDLNWMEFDAECDVRFLKYYYKLKTRTDSKPGGLDAFLLETVQRRGLSYKKEVEKI